MRTFDEPWMATGTIVAPDCSASRPIPGRTESDSLPVRDRPPSAYIATVPPLARIPRAVMNASSSA